MNLFPINSRRTNGVGYEEAVPCLVQKGEQSENSCVWVWTCLPVQKHISLDLKEGGKRVGRDEEAAPHLVQKDEQSGNPCVWMGTCLPVQKYMSLDQKEGGKRAGRDEEAVPRQVQKDEQSGILVYECGPVSLFRNTCA